MPAPPTTADNSPRAGDDVTRELNELRIENERLRQERDGLRRLLGMSPELHDAHRSVVGSSLLDDTGDVFVGTDRRSSPDRKVALFRSLFRGRDDVFARRWSNDRTGKSGYSPAVRGSWNSPGSHADRPLLPLTDSVVQEHLRGNMVAGVFPMLPDGSCWFVACDFDGDTWALDSLAYMRACADASVPAALERSRSGRGAHVWTFFSEPVPAVTARRLAMQLLRAAMDERCEIDLASYDRMFPNQDHVPKGGYGNLIALPLQHAARRNGNSEFLDPSTMTPWPDQWTFLAQVRKLTSAALDELIEYLPPVGIGPDADRRGAPRHRNEQPAPERVTCTLGSQLSIERSGLPASLVTALKHAAMLHNPEWHQRRQLRLSTHDVPRFVRCYSEDITHLHLPRGLLDISNALITEAGSRTELVDARVTPSLEDPLVFQLDLSDGQQQAVDDVLAHDFGVLVAPPGAGKTRMACRVIAERNTPTLVLAHTRPLLDQWRMALTETLGMTSRQIGQQGGGRKRRTHIVDLAMLQSLSRIDDLRDFFAGYGLVVIDECHHIPAVSFENVVGLAPARFVLGLTATPIRRDGLQDIITMQCGTIRHRMTAQQATRDGELRPGLQLHKRVTQLACADHERDRTIQEQFTALVDDHQRTRLVCDDIIEALDRGRRCIVLSQWRRHCVYVVQDLVERGVAPILLHGELGKKERTRLMQQLKDTMPDEPLVVVATSQLLGEGFDCPQLDTLFLTFPISFKGRLIQYVGRLMRSNDDKYTVEVYDYIDKGVPVLAAMAAKRAKAYASLGFTETASAAADQVHTNSA